MGRKLTMSPDALELSMYGDNSRIMTDYLNDRLDYLGRNGHSRSSRLYDTVRSSLNYLNDEVRRHSLNVELNRTRAKSAYRGIVNLDDFESLMLSDATMQRWIMTEPRLKRLYLDKNLAGYQGSYSNFTGEGVGRDDYNYRRATHGMVIEDENGDGQVWHFDEDLIEDDRDLTFFEKSSILSTWETMREIMENTKRDFTSPSGEYLDMNID